MIKGVINKMKVLNLGCGYTKQGLRVDINPKCDPDIIANVCLPLPIKDKFKMVTAIEIMEHVCNPQGLIKNMLKYMTKNGVGIITTPNALGYELSYRYRGKKQINDSVQQYLTPCVIKGLIRREGGKILYQNIGSIYWIKHIEIIFCRR